MCHVRWKGAVCFEKEPRQAKIRWRMLCSWYVADWTPITFDTNYC